MQDETIPLDGNTTSIDAAEANQLINTQWQVARINQMRADDYHLKCRNAALTILQKGMEPEGGWPKVPTGMVVGPPNGGWQWPAEGTEPVCPPQPEPPIPGANLQHLVANTIEIGTRIRDTNFYGVGDNDTWPINHPTPPTKCTDGETHVLLRLPAPVGSQKMTLPDGTVVVHGGWYEILS